MLSNRLSNNRHYLVLTMKKVREQDAGTWKARPVLLVSSKPLSFPQLQSLVKSDLPLLENYEDASEGFRCVGFIYKVLPKGCVVEFLNHVCLSDWRLGGTAPGQWTVLYFENTPLKCDSFFFGALPVSFPGARLGASPALERGAAGHGPHQVLFRGPGRAVSRAVLRPSTAPHALNYPR